VTLSTVCSSLLLLTLAAAACSGQSGQPARAPGAVTPDNAQDSRPLIAPNAPPQFEPRACWGSLPRAVVARCGYVVVPENRSSTNGTTRAIRLAVMVLSGAEARPAEPPTVRLGGGPGQDVVALYLELIRRYQSVLDNGYPPERLLRSTEDVRQFEAVMARLVADLGRRELILLDQRGAGYSEPSLRCPDDDWRRCRAQLAASGIDLTA
jgi:hypothetical protein